MNWTGGPLSKVKRKLNKKDQERARIENYIKKRQYDKMKQKFIFPSLYRGASFASTTAQQSFHSANETVMDSTSEVTTLSTRSEEQDDIQIPTCSKYLQTNQSENQPPLNFKHRIKSATQSTTTTIIDNDKKIYQQINKQITWNFDTEEEEEERVTFEPEAINEFFQI